MADPPLTHPATFANAPRSALPTHVVAAVPDVPSLLADLQATAFPPQLEHQPIRVGHQAEYRTTGQMELLTVDPDQFSPADRRWLRIVVGSVWSRFVAEIDKHLGMEGGRAGGLVAPGAPPDRRADVIRHGARGTGHRGCSGGSKEVGPYTLARPLVTLVQPLNERPSEAVLKCSVEYQRPGNAEG